MSASSGVRDVAVDAPEGGTVRISVLGSTETGEPTEEDLAAISDVVLSDSVRALCHAVSVVSADIITVNISAELTLLPTVQSSIIDNIETVFRAAFETSRGLGWDLTPSWIVAQLQTGGVHSVELVNPTNAVTVAPNQCVSLGTLTLTYAGMAV
jgi:phage-related baseplate assembly protein